MLVAEMRASCAQKLYIRDYAAHWRDLVLGLQLEPLSKLLVSPLITPVALPLYGPVYNPV